MSKFHRTAYNHFGTQLAVSGERTQDGCIVERVTAADSDVDLFDILHPSTIATIADRVDTQLAAEARAHNISARAERHQWHREFRVAA
jgi:hypothetical protein